jgi:hypothetical protein
MMSSEKVKCQIGALLRGRRIAEKTRATLGDVALSECRRTGLFF